MAIQQMALMAYKAPPAGGGDSAFLPDPLVAENTSGDPVSIAFGYSLAVGGANTSNVTTDGSVDTDYTWKTGPNAASAYEVMYTKTSGITPDGSSVNTWITLGTTDVPKWTVTFGTGQFCGGRMVIRNISVPGTELANVAASLSADPAA